jgi:dihydroflavonol-4-reductase
LEIAQVATLESIKTLVTGATGFVGWHVTRLLTERAGHVRVLVRPTSESRAIDGLKVDRVCGDLRDLSSLNKALEGVSRVFHVAADYRLWAKNPDEIYQSNVGGTLNLIDASRRAGVERFIYTSSVATMAVPAGEGLPDETTEAGLDQMIGHYKRSKFLAEREVITAAANGFPAVVVNPTTPIGPGDWKPTPTGRIIVDFLNGRIPAYVDTGFNVVAVEDVAEGHWLAARRGRIGER